MSASALSVFRSAFRAGSLSSLLLRRSSRAPSGLVVAAGFGRFAAAAGFARLWSRRLGVSVVVRRAPAGFVVSVPVAWPSSRLPRCFAWRLPVSGLGVRGFAQLVRGSGVGGF